MQEGAPKRRAFLFSTVKGLTGHQESGAGVAGLQAASLLVQAASAPPALHLRHLNPHVHGALTGHAVSIARGGPYGVPHTQPSNALMLGVSSFGAQGTNAHALLAGSGSGSAASAEIVGASQQQPPAWRRARCYVAPAVQQLLSSCVLRGKRGSRGGTMAFDSLLSAPRLAYLWQYNMQGRAQLASSAVLSMAVSLLPLLGAVAAGEDAATAAAVAAVTEAAVVAPVALPLAAAARVAPAIARLKLIRASGAVELALADQKVLAAKLSSVAAASASPLAAAAAGGRGAVRAVRALVTHQIANHAAVGSSSSAVAQVAHLPAAEASGYALHPVLLDACLGQAAGLAATATTPLTWLRSAEALLVGASGPTGGVIAAAYQPADSWHTGGASLSGGAGSAVVLLGVVLGDQGMPPASPGPASMPLPAAAGAEVAEEAQVQGVPADHPLLQMPEEERLLHLQAQVGWEGCRMGAARQLLRK